MKNKLIKGVSALRQVVRVGSLSLTQMLPTSTTYLPWTARVRLSLNASFSSGTSVVPVKNLKNLRDKQEPSNEHDNKKNTFGLDKKIKISSQITDRTTAPVAKENKVTKVGAAHFFRAFYQQTEPGDSLSIPSFLKKETTLKSLLCQIDCYIKENYLHDHFIYWLSAYASASTPILKNYFAGKCDLDAMVKDFSRFCFDRNIDLDADKTLKSFDYHNKLSDTAVKRELSRLTPKAKINIFGFGLDEGYYEKSLGNFLLEKGIAKEVNLYGYDPYPFKTPGIEYLSQEQLRSKETPDFDIVIARWVLHHVSLGQRWRDFIHCINRCSPGAMVLVVEHGFLREPTFSADKKLYYLFNATFDVVANIGLRPRYFTDTAPNIGANFFIHYLEPVDFSYIKQNARMPFEQTIYEVGPGFPNQTICCMRG